MKTADDAPPTVLIEMIFPEHANHYGTLFGGNGLSMMARAAFVAASRTAHSKVVLARANDVTFRAPIPVGSTLELTARVVRRGRTSMTVTVDGVCERAPGGPRVPVATGAFEMVAVDDAGRPQPLANSEETLR